MAERARLSCPRCDSTENAAERNNPNKRPKRHAELNAVFRLYRCTNCDHRFVAVEMVLDGSVAELIESEVGSLDW